MGKNNRAKSTAFHSRRWALKVARNHGVTFTNTPSNRKLYLAIKGFYDCGLAESVGELWLEYGKGKTKEVGGVKTGTQESSEFFSSRSWLRLRYEALKRYGPVCCLCGATRKDQTIHVDHIKPRSLFPELALDFDNLQILCKPCNFGKSNTDSTDWR